MSFTSLPGTIDVIGNGRSNSHCLTKETSASNLIIFEGTYDAIKI